ncbi:MAG: hypothetical protein V5A16_03710 [Haloplanus sp.]
MGSVEAVTVSVRSTSLTRTATESLPALRALAEFAARPVRFVAFWLATLLPFTYLPLLAMGVVTTHTDCCNCLPVVRQDGPANHRH